MIQGMQNLALTSQDYILSQLPSEQIPNSLLNYPPIIKLDSVLLKNFKSFKQQTYTGPFLGFTSIIGPNGSGKSNIVDGLMFCLCGENLKHNFFDLRQYINKQRTQSYRQMSQNDKKCSVQANFLLSNNKILSLKRQLDPEKNQKFFIDHEEVSKNIYENFLFRQGINPHVPNYVVTQGQIDKLLLREPIQLTQLIQNLSGSVMYKKRYENVKQEIQQLKKNRIILTQRMLKLKNDKKNAKSINQASKQCQQLQRQYDQTMNRLFLAKVYIAQMDLQDYQEQINKKKQQEKQKINSINQRKLKIQQEMKRKQQLNRQVGLIEKKILELNSILKTINKPDIQIKVTQLENGEKEVNFIRDQIDNLELKKKKLQESVPQVHTSQVINEYLRLFTEWQTKNREIKLQLDNKRTLYFNLQTQRQFQKSLLDQQIQKQKKLNQENIKRKNDIESGNNQINQITQLIAKMKRQNSLKEEKYKKNQKMIRQYKQEWEKMDNQVQNLEELITENVESQKDKEIIKRLCIIDGFKGIIQQKIRPRRDKQAVAFSILTEKISKYLLCKDQPSSKQISQKLRDMNTAKTLIILSNIKRSSQNISSTKQAIGKSGIMAIQIIDYDKNLQGLQSFLTQFCRNKVICEDLKSAFEIRSRKIPGIKQIITFDGEVLRSDGMITSYGNPQHLKKALKLGSNKSSLQNQLRKALKSRDQLNEKIQKIQKQYKPEQQIRINDQIIKLQKKKLQIQQKIQFLMSIKPKQLKSFKNIEKDIQMLNDKLEKVNKEINLIEKGMSKNSIFNQFMKKHNITNLQSFRSTSNLEYLQKQSKRKSQLIKMIDQTEEKIKILKQKIDNKMIRINHLKQDLAHGTSTNDKKDIESEIEKLQKKLKEVRQQSSKLAIFREEDIQHRSQVIEMQNKLRFLKQKNRELVEDLKSQMGIMINTPKSRQDYKLLEDYISGDLHRLNHKKLQKVIKDLQTEQRLCQEKLEKFNSMNLLSRNIDREENQINEEIKRINKSIEQNTNKRNQLNETLEKLKNQRKAVFMSFFEKLKVILKQTYEILTQTEPGLTGSANLYLQNSEVPFEYGVYFTPTPAKKRLVYDLEQLSGGEKSLASLSLQYALAMTSRAPFLILDESDAYLDGNNSKRMLRLISESFTDKKLQIIIVTHKSHIFQNSQSLVGVTRPKNQFSQVFSLKVK